MLGQLLGRLGAEVVHRSVPHGRDMWLPPGRVDAAVVIVRSWGFVMQSQLENQHDFIWRVRGMDLQTKMQVSFQAMVEGLVGMQVPWTLVTYEGIVHNTEAMVTQLADFLGTRPIEMVGIHDGNARRHRARAG